MQLKDEQNKVESVWVPEGEGRGLRKQILWYAVL